MSETTPHTHVAPDPAPILSADGDWRVRLADLLDDPLPADWQDALAVEARQDHLAAVAHAVGEAAVTWFVVMGERAERSAPYDRRDPATAAFVGAVARLYRALGDYTHDTQRDDGRAIIHEALAFAAGPTTRRR